jgi:hypothetical protein
MQVNSGRLEDINETSFNAISQFLGVQPQPQTSTNITTIDKVFVSVNKYVHQCEKIPPTIKPQDIAKWEQDYQSNARLSKQLKTLD